MTSFYLWVIAGQFATCMAIRSYRLVNAPFDDDFDPLFHLPRDPDEPPELDDADWAMSQFDVTTGEFFDV